jgi:hypothetical protein
MSHDTSVPENGTETATVTDEPELSRTPPGFNDQLRECIGKLSAAAARPTEHLEITTPETGVSDAEPAETDRPFVRVTVNYAVEDDVNPTLATVELRPNVASDSKDVMFGYTVRVGLSSKNTGKTPLNTMWFDDINWAALGVGNPHIRAFAGSENSHTDTFDFGYKSESPMQFNDAIDMLSRITAELRAYKDTQQSP